jgi:hypothetical protein
MAAHNLEGWDALTQQPRTYHPTNFTSVNAGGPKLGQIAERPHQ